MATDQQFADYVRDQMSSAGDVTSRKMFGEYAIYLDGKVVALVCDNQCFVKPTEEGRAYLGQVAEAHPFPGANRYFLIADELDDRQRVSELVRITARALPPPKQKKQSGAKAAKKSAPKRLGATKPAGDITVDASAFSRLADALRREGGIDAKPATPGRGFGARALKVQGKIFAMPVNGALGLKLPAKRVQQLIAGGRGAPFDAGGRVMREWVAINGDEHEWLALAREARDFVKA